MVILYRGLGRASRAGGRFSGQHAPTSAWIGSFWICWVPPIVFILIEKLLALRDQPVFRPEWQTDFHHFIVNHLLVGFALLVVNKAVNTGFGWAVNADVQAWIRGLPLVSSCSCASWCGGPGAVRHASRVSRGAVKWRLHAVHHSAKTMDWLAGSRQHVIEVILTRTLVLAPIFVLGFSKPVVDAYILIVGFQAVFNHANVSVRLGHSPT